MSKYIIIPIIFTSTIVYGDNQKFNEYAIFCEKMIVTLQSCTDEKSTFSHSSEFPIILYTVLNENPLKDFFKSQKGALYHIMLLAEIERLNHHKWFNLSSMKNHVDQIEAEKNILCNGIEDPSSAVSAKEKIINYVNNLNDNKSDILYLISYLLDIYKINDLELFMKIMSISDCELLKKIDMIEKKIGSLQINHLERTTIKHLIKEIQNKYKIHENIYNELRKKLNSNID